MLGLHYQDDRELAQALLSTARRSSAIGARFFYLGSEDTFERARQAARYIDPAGLPAIAFSPLDARSRGQSAEAWCATIEAVRSGVLRAAAGARSTVVWIEGPIPHRSIEAGQAVRIFVQSLEKPPLPVTLLCAYELPRLPIAGRAALLEGCDWVVSATMLPRCPCWLPDFRNRPAATAEETQDPAIPAESVPHFTALMQAEKMAALGQLTATVAHELGNPLSIISSSLQYLHERLSAAHDGASEFALTALANVDRMQGLLRKMLDAAASKRAVFERADIGEIVSEILRLTAAECERRRVAVEVSFDPALPRAWVEPHGVKQILLNLVKNALDAMVQGGNVLWVRTRLGESSGAVPGSAIIVELGNNGPQIPRDVLPHLFRPFHTTKQGGTGLGLYLSRQIAKDHGGDLEAANLPNGEVCFTLRLPVDRRRRDENGSHPDRR